MSSRRLLATHDRALRLTGVTTALAITLAFAPGDAVAADRKVVQLGLMRTMSDDGCEKPEGASPAWRRAKACDFVERLGAELAKQDVELRIVFATQWELYSWAMRSRLDAILVSAAADHLLTAGSVLVAAPPMIPLVEFRERPGPGLPPGGSDEAAGSASALLLDGRLVDRGAFKEAVRGGYGQDSLDARSHLSSSSFIVPLMEAKEASPSEEVAAIVERVTRSALLYPALEVQAGALPAEGHRLWKVLPWTAAATEHLEMPPDFAVAKYLDMLHEIPFDRLLMRSEAAAPEVRSAVERALAGTPETGDYVAEAPSPGASGLPCRDRRCAARQMFGERMDELLGSLPLESPLRRGFAKGEFSFSLNQAVNLLNFQRSADEAAQALVLSGGGVKSVFQAVVLDSLLPSGGEVFGKTREDLEREAEIEGRWRPTLIAGTSGGAVTAVIAWLKLLTGDSGKSFSSFWPIRHLDVMSFMETLRHVSLLLCIAILVLVLVAARWIAKKKIDSLTLGLENPRANPSLMVLAGTSLLLVPYLVGFDNRVTNLPVDGSLYLLSILIAFALICYVNYLPPEADGKGRLRVPGIRLLPGANVLLLLATWVAYVTLEFPRPLLCAFSGAIGVAAVFLVLARDQMGTSLLLKTLVPMTVVSAVVGQAGGHPCMSTSLAVLVAVFALAWSPFSRLQKREASMPQFIPIVALAHVGLTGLLFFVLAKGRPEDIASELIARYWTVLMVASLISALLASTALLLIVHSKRQKLAARIVRSGTLAVDWGPANARPWSIFLVLCAFGLVWWNAEVPAALYGNKRLRDHFRSDLESWFPARAQALALTGSSSGPDLVITGAVLNAGSASCYKGDQIFWRLPGGEDLAEAAPIPVRQGAPPQVLALPGSELVPLPVANSRQEDWLIAIALASGAPFPLLPAVGFETRVVDQGGSTTCEILLPSSPQDSPVPLTQALVRLANGEGRHSDTAFGVIDGGYSNVVPIAISKELGAKAVILINSTPQCPSAKKGDFGLHLGALPSNLGRLFGYLWERSQESDRMASDDLLITEIRPPGSSDFCPAPFLLQFTPKVIDSWLGATRRAIEQGEGIATVKSWGLPVTTAVPLRN